MHAKPFRIINKQLSDYNIHWLIITIKLALVFLAFAGNFLVRKLLCPLVPPARLRSPSDRSKGTSVQ
jgi:hypothetical protein